MSTTEKKRTHVGPYEIGRKLGEGTFGKVKLGRNIFTNEKVAIKILKYRKVKTPAEKKLVEREKAVLQMLNHPHIVKLIKLLDDPERGCCYMVIEYVSGGELFDYIVSHGRLREKDARKFIRQMISALEYCHAHLIIHRDLKPENLLLDENLDIKITDFGLSNMMSPGKKFTTFCGSLHYACPEILRGEEYVGPGADIWAMGVILYCLVTGSQPWSAPTSEDILQQIMLEGLQIPAWLTPECTDLIVQMLRLKEKDRITLAEMRKHPWVMKDHTEPPTTHLPEVSPTAEIDEYVMGQVKQIGFEGTEEERAAIMRGEQIQVVVTYNLLLNKRREELDLERKKKDEDRALREAVAAANAQLGGLGLDARRSPAIPESLGGRARANSTFVQPYLPEDMHALDLEDEEPVSHTRERSGSEPPAFFVEDPVRLAAMAAEAEDELSAMLSSSPSKTSKKSGSRIKVKGPNALAMSMPNPSHSATSSSSSATTTTSSGGSSASPSGVSPRPRHVPSLALDAVHEEDEGSVKRSKKEKDKKRTKVSSARSQDQPDRSANGSPSPVSTPRSSDTREEDSDNGESGPDSAAVPSNKMTKRPVLKLEDIPKIREAQGDKPKSKPHHHMVSPRRRAHQIEKKPVHEVFADLPPYGGSPSSSTTTTTASSSNATSSSASKTSGDVTATSEVNAALFGCSTTSTLSIHDIHKRILTVLSDTKGVIIKSSNSTSFRCVYTDVSFKIEIVSIAKFDHLRGVKMSRVTGDLWKYKEIAAKIIAKLKL
jgi:serine/threonine protein kinase